MEIGAIALMLIGPAMTIGGVIWLICIEFGEEKQRRKEVELAAEKERRRENRDKLRYKTAKVLERGQKRQHRHERDTQYPARPLPPRKTRPVLPPHEDAGEP